MTILERAIETYGKDMQLNVAIEEFSELIKEICKHKRGEDNLDNIIEEMADCYIMLEQLKIIFEIEDVSVADVIQMKLNRLEKRLAKKGEQGMRDRLIELLEGKSIDTRVDVEYVADYLLANGVIVPPCKVNKKVYVITSQTSDNRNLYIFEDRITHYRICDSCTIMCFDRHLGVPSWNWNKVFLTREEAEKALAERSENEHRTDN